MDFIIKCDTFIRLSEIPKNFKPIVSEEEKKLLTCVRLEYKSGKSYAISTNREIAAIQYLGETQEADAVAHVLIEPNLIEQCRKELQYDSLLTITTVPEIALGVVKTMLGYEFNGNCCIFPDRTPMDEWRTWSPEKPPAKSNGVMYWDADIIASLAASSPSGKLYFPQHVDVEQPIIVRDLFDPKWVGLFIPKPDITEKQVRTPATLPEWWAA